MFGDGVQELDLLNENLQRYRRKSAKDTIPEITEQSLPSLRLMGNIITSVIKKQPTLPFLKSPLECTTTNRMFMTYGHQPTNSLFSMGREVCLRYINPLFTAGICN